jgi:hypothetical protein
MGRKSQSLLLVRSTLSGACSERHPKLVLWGWGPFPEATPSEGTCSKGKEGKKKSKKVNTEVNDHLISDGGRV